MIRKKHIAFVVFLFLFILMLYHVFIPYIKNRILLKKCNKIYANQIIKLPDKGEKNIGFTCTGLFWDKEEKKFLIGNAGKYKPDDEKYKATIEIVADDFSSITNSIPCYLKFKNMRDIQGVTKSSDGTIWISSCGENKIRHIDQYGNEINHFDILEPSGIANDQMNSTLWILSKQKLCNCTYDGQIIKQIDVNVKGQDHLYLDEVNHFIYFSAGIDYYGDNYIYTVNLKTNEVKPLYILKDSYAVEGITIINNKLYVLNDGYYHNAKIPINQVNIYYLDNLLIDKK